MKVEDENNILLECLAYTLIRYEFHNICYNKNLYNLLTYQNYNELRKHFDKIFEWSDKILKETNYY